MKRDPLIEFYYSDSIYPTTLVYRMFTLNRTTSGDLRVIGIQYKGGRPYRDDDFKRINLNYFKEELYNRLPYSIHLGLFQSLQIQKDIFLYKEPQLYGNNIKLKDDYHCTTDSPQISLKEKELVFDIDVTDFNRFCDCREISKMCNICSIHLLGSHLILNHYLKEVFGYNDKNILWVFSGCKGIHCFVNSLIALKLTDKERVNLFNFIHIDKNDDDKLKSYINYLQKTDPLFINQLISFFEENVIKKRNLFLLEAFESYCLSKIQLHYNVIHQIIKNNWSKISSLSLYEEEKENVSLKKWMFLGNIENTQFIDNENLVKPSLFIIFKLFYPIIDKGPMTMSHLIKTPFSLHSLTSNISLPVDSNDILNIDITKDFITIKQLHSHYQLNNQLHPTFIKGMQIFREWVSQYSR